MKRLVSRLAAVLLFAAAPALLAQAPTSFAGHWTGSIRLPAQELAFDVDLTAGDSGYTGDISIPAQNAHDLPLTGILVSGDSITFIMPNVPGNPTFRGVRAAGGKTIAGDFTQGSQTFSFSMQTAAAPADAARQALAGFDQWVDSAMAAWKVVGMGVGIMVDGQIVYAHGHGYRDLQRKLPVTTQTLFAIGSSSKAFTVFALGTLVDQGKLAWDNPVIDYLPDFRMYDPDVTRRLTVRDLVTHRSGLPRHDLVWYNDHAISRAELVHRLRFLPPNKDLRETFQYNNLMFVTAGYLVGQVVGKPWEQAIQQIVFQPLGMTGTDVTVAAMQQAPDYSLGYEVRNDTIQRLPFRDISLVGPAGSINSSVDDMLKWVGMHLADGTVNGRQLIQPSTLHQMYAPQMTIAAMPDRPELGATGYGMGWFIQEYRGHYLVQHGGNIDGFSALVALFPQDHVGMVILSNQNGAALPGLVLRHAADRIFHEAPVDWNTQALAQRDRARSQQKEAEAKKTSVRIPNTHPSHPLADYVGDYADSGYGTLHITMDGGRLVATYHDIPTTLEHWHYDVFNGTRNAKDPTFEDMKYQFQNDMDGSVALVRAPFEPSVDPIVFHRLPDDRLSDPAFLQRFVGRYALVNDTVTVNLQGNTLIAVVGNQPPYQLVPKRGTEFLLKGLTGFSVVFTLTADGTVTEAQFRQPNGVFTAKRIR
jgi:CubicO group peptidase (beta-lactamase class C family)